jgi:hypothetical protein
LPDECEEESSKGLLLVVELQDQPDKPQVHQHLGDHDRHFIMKKRRFQMSSSTAHLRHGERHPGAEVERMTCMQANYVFDDIFFNNDNYNGDHY